MRRHRGIWASLLLLLLLVGVGGSTWYVGFVRLPHPRQATARQLMRWMVQRDISAEPYELQLALVDRVETELRDGVRADHLGTQLTEAQQRQFRDNTEHLTFVWFSSRVRRYHRLTPDQRLPFLRRQLNTADDLVALSSAVDGDPEPGGMTTFFNKIEAWISQTDGGQREQMQLVVQDGLVCWLATEDLNDHSTQTRHDLAQRIATSLDQRGHSRLDSDLPLSPSQKVALRNNGVLLFESWFTEQARRYDATPLGQRDALVARQIARVRTWRILDFLLSPEGVAEEKSDLVRLIGLSRMANQWVARAAGEDQQKMRNLLSHVQRKLVRP